MNQPQTVIDKLWAAHEILRRDDGESLLWVDRHYVHEGSFHAFSKLAERGAKVAEPGLTFGVADHYVPTRGSRKDIANPELARMVRQVEENTTRHVIRLFGIGDPRQGIVRWSVVRQVPLLPESMAGLPEPRARVGVRPPLYAMLLRSGSPVSTWVQLRSGVQSP